MQNLKQLKLAFKSPSLSIVSLSLALMLLADSTFAGALYRSQGVYQPEVAQQRIYNNGYYVDGYTGNESAERAFRTIFTGNTIAGAHTMRDVISDPGSEICADCSMVHMASYDGESFDNRSGDYNITSNDERAALIQQIKNGGREHMGVTTMTIGGETLDVLNDNITLPDGTYVPLTFPEAREIAEEWGCRIPNASQLVAIGQHAAQNGNQYTALTRTPNDNTRTQMLSMNQMMNDPRMHERAEAGQDRLIDGHFKWYDDQGRIYGFARGNGRFWQNSPSGAHVGDPGYYDYSHGVRLVCPSGTSV